MREETLQLCTLYNNTIYTLMSRPWSFLVRRLYSLKKRMVCLFCSYSICQIHSLESQLEASEDRFQASIRMQHELDNKCKALKERVRVLENDLESEKMFPLVGLEVCEGHCKGEAYRNMVCDYNHSIRMFVF